MLGPVYWSSAGYTLVQDDFYEVPNLFSTSIAAPDATPPTAAPELVVYNNGGGDILVVNSVYLNSLWGLTDQSRMYPNAFSGSQLTTLLDSYTRFNAVNNIVNQSPLVGISSSPIGSPGIMVANAIPDPDVATVTAVAPFDGAGQPINTESGNPRIAEIPAKTLVSAIMMDPSDGLLAVVANASSVMNASKTPSIRQYRILLKKAMINKSALPSEPAELGQPIAAPYAADVPNGASIGAIVNSINASLFHPNSKFSDGLKQFEDKYPIVYATLKSVVKNPEIQRYLKDALKPFAVKMFGKVKSVAPELQDMGAFVKHLTPQNAAAVQNVVSRSQTISKDTQAVQDDGHKSLIKSVLKHGLNAVKMVASDKTVQKTVATAALGAIPFLTSFI